MSGLLDRHLGFLEALRAAGVPVSLAEGLDAVAALGSLRWGDRETVRDGVRRHAGQAAGAAADLRRALRPVLPAAGRCARRPGPAPRRPRQARSGTTPPRSGGFREQLADALADGDRAGPARPRGRGRGPVRRDARSRARAVAAGRRTPPCNGSRPSELVEPVVAALLADGRPRRRRDVRPAAGSAPSPGSSRTTPAAGSPRRRVPTRRRRRRSGPTIDRLDFTAARQADLERDAPRDLPPGPAAGHPADPGAARPAPRPARLPAYRPGVDLDRRRPAHHPPPAQAPAPHRAGRAVRRQRLGGQLRAVHAAARLRAARPVHQGAGLHLRRPGARGDPPLPPRRRRRPR